jgi:hypothetical protein
MNLIEYHIYLKSMIKYVEIYQIYRKQTRPPDIKPSKTVPNKCRASTKQRLFWAWTLGDGVGIEESPGGLWLLHVTMGSMYRFMKLYIMYTM